MADKKISELSLASSVANDDVLPIVQSGVTKKVPISVLLGAVNLSSIVNLNVSQTLTANTANITTETVTTLNATTETVTTLNATNVGSKKESYVNFEVIDNADIIDVTTSLTLCTNSLGEQYSATLPAGTNGLVKKILFAEGLISVSSSFGHFWTTITVQSNQGSVELIWFDVLNGWFVSSATGVTIGIE